MYDLRKKGFDVINKCTPCATANAGGKLEYNREQYKSNKEKILKRQAGYYKNGPKVTCECCNKEFTKDHLKKHKKLKNTLII